MKKTVSDIQLNTLKLLRSSARMTHGFETGAIDHKLNRPRGRSLSPLKAMYRRGWLSKSFRNNTWSWKITKLGVAAMKFGVVERGGS